MNGTIEKKFCWVPEMMVRRTAASSRSATMPASSVNSVVVTGTARNAYGSVNHWRA